MSEVQIKAERDVSIGGDAVGRDKIGRDKITNIYYAEKKERPIPRMAPPAPRIFIGRDEVLRELIAALKLGEDGTSPIALTALKGMGGIGKTTLAAALANHPEVETALPEGTLWAGLGPEPEVMSLLAEWGAQLGEDFAQLDSPEARSRRLSTLLHDKKALLIIDDVWQAEAARHFLVGGPRCRALITTRDNEIARKLAGHEAVRVETLTNTASLNLLRELAPDAVSADEKAANELATVLDGLPLAITLAGQMLAAEWEAGLGVAGALSELKDRETRLQLAGAEKRAGLATTELSLRAILAMSYDRLPDDATKRAFRLLGVFGGKPLTFSIEAAAAVWGLDLRPAQKMMVALVGRALVEPIDVGRYALHKTLSDFSESLLEEDGKAAPVREAHANYYLEFAQTNAEKNWQAVEMEMGQIRSGFDWVSYNKQTASIVSYVQSLSSFMQRRGLWNELLDWAELGLLSCELTRDKPALASMLAIIGSTHNLRSAWGKALEYYERCRVIREEINDRARLAHTLNSIGMIYYRKGSWDQALEYYERSRVIQEEIGDRDGLASTLNSIGMNYDNRGLWDQALEYYESSRAIIAEIGDRGRLAAILNNIAGAYKGKGLLDQALEYYEGSKVISEEIGDRFGLLIMLNNIGRIYDKKGLWDQALEYYEGSLAISEKIGHRYGLAMTLNNIGRIYFNKGLWDQALIYCERSRAVSEEIGNRPGLVKTLNNIGLISFNKGFWDQALAYYKRSQAIAEEIGDRAGHANTLCHIGDVLEKQGELTDAEQVLTQAVAIFESLGSPDLDNARKQLDRVNELQRIASQK